MECNGNCDNCRYAEWDYEIRYWEEPKIIGCGLKKKEEMDNRVHQLIDELIGTCESLDEGCTRLGFNSSDLTADELRELDERIFLCEDCGWWYDLGELDMSDDGFDNICIHCADCREEEL